MLGRSRCDTVKGDGKGGKFLHAEFHADAVGAFQKVGLGTVSAGRRLRSGADKDQERLFMDFSGSPPVDANL